MFHSIIPTLRVSDSRKSEALFDKLGFNRIWEHQEDDQAPRFIEVGRDKASLFLSEHNGDGPLGISLYFVVDHAQELYEQAKTLDVEITVELHLAEWGHWMFAVEDYDGNTLRFGTPEE